MTQLFHVHNLLICCYYHVPQDKLVEPLSTSETMSDETVREVRGPEYVQAKPSEEPSLFTALKIRMPTVIREVEQVLDLVELAEFGPAEWPLRELATISVLTRHGVSTEQVTIIILFFVY
jgi:hypothetical protein